MKYHGYVIKKVPTDLGDAEIIPDPMVSGGYDA